MEELKLFYLQGTKQEQKAITENPKSLMTFNQEFLIAEIEG